MLCCSTTNNMRCACPKCPQSNGTWLSHCLALKSHSLAKAAKLLTIIQTLVNTFSLRQSLRVHMHLWAQCWSTQIQMRKHYLPQKKIHATLNMRDICSFVLPLLIQKCLASHKEKITEITSCLIDLSGRNHDACALLIEFLASYHITLQI